MGKTYSTFQGTKVSGAVRRIGNLAGRTRREWREHKALSNHAFAGEVARKTAAPRLLKRHDVVSAELTALSIEDAILDAATIGLQDDAPAVPVTARPRIRKVSAETFEDAILQALQGR
jgi:hypothetical protein